MDYRKLADAAAATTGLLLQVPEEITKVMELIDQELQPQNFLELGVADGGTFFIWCHLTRPGGIKLGIELPNGPWGFKPKSDAEVLATQHYMQTLAPNCHIRLGHSRDTLTLEWVKEKLNGKLLDFIFIDADHSYEGVKADYKNYYSFVRPGGWILMHDIRECENHKGFGCTVHQFWQELEADKTEFIHPEAEWGGIGLVRVPL